MLITKRVKKDLFSNNEKGKEITIIKQYDSEAEAREVVSKIIEIKNRDKVDYNSFTILYRSSYCSRAFEKELISKKIPYQVFSGIKFYERKEIKDAMAYFNLMLNPLDNVSILRILNVPRRGIGENCFKHKTRRKTK